MQLERHALFWMAAALLFAYLAQLLAPVLLPFAIGLSLAYFLNPIVDAMGRLGVPRWVSAILLLALSLFLIVIAELLNSAIEWTIDDISLEKRLFAKRAKDMGSAAVFMAYINCVTVWGIILFSNWERIARLEFLRWPPPFLP